MSYCNLDDAFQEPFRFKTNKNQKPIEYDVKLDHNTRQAAYNHLDAEQEFTQDIALLTPPNPYTTYEYYENELPHLNSNSNDNDNTKHVSMKNTTQETPKLNLTTLEKLEQKIDDLNTKMNMVLAGVTKLGNPRSDQENLHDIILFTIFGIFFIYILDQMRKRK